MKPGRFDLPIIWRGSIYPAVVFTWLDGGGTPVDLTPFAAAATTKDFALPITFSDPVNGVAQISMTQAQTVTLNLGVYQWNWMFTQISTGIKGTPLISGEVEVKEPVSTGTTEPPTT